jgi:glycyl-tRNA synthetase beta chain
MSERAEFLLEIGCEEIPACWLAGLGDQLRQRFSEGANREQLEPSEIRVLWTPRRLVLAAQVMTRQADREDKVWGPSLKVAKDTSGQWSGAAQGFARKVGAAVDELGQGPKDAGGESYLLFVKQVAGRDAAEVLPGILTSVLRGLSFPKRMSWDAWLDDGKGSFPFGRPIRWLVALLGGQVLPLAIYEQKDGGKGSVVVAAGNASLGHRFLPRGSKSVPFAVSSLADLQQKLREHFVVLDPEERATRIRQGLRVAAAGDVLHDPHGLAEEWRDLVEYPTVLSGRIPEEFRSLPAEVLETVLVHHQKYAPIAGEGRQVIRFAAITNGDGSNAAEIVRGMERVVVARLRDAAFFFEEDRKRPLGERVADLAGVTFHQGLGSYQAKAERLVRLVDAMGEKHGLLTKPERESARQAALLAKADLTTLMVREFPELQGVMGGIYLRAEGSYWESVAGAVHWHYHPLSVEEDAPPKDRLEGSDSTVFAAVSVADKLDTVAGYFGLGLIPTGSSDPYGLRRAAQGAVRVLLDFWVADANERRPSLRALAAEAVAGYGGLLKRPAGELLRDLEAFLLDRVRYVLSSRGFPADEVEAALGAREPDALEDPKECLDRLRALHRVRAEVPQDFEQLAVAFKRAKNIVGEGPHAAADPALFEKDAERELFEAVGRLETVNGGYEARLRSLATLRGPVDRFFNDVLVMAEDPKLRANRLGLLSPALALFYRIADISKLGG